MKKIMKQNELIPYDYGNTKDQQVTFVDREGDGFSVNTAYNDINKLHSTDMHKKIFELYGDNENLVVLALNELRLLLGEQFKNRVKYLLLNLLRNYNNLVCLNIKSDLNISNDDDYYDEECECNSYDPRHRERWFNLVYPYKIIELFTATIPNYFDIEYHINGIYTNPIIMTEMANLIVTYEMNELQMGGYPAVTESYTSMTPQIIVLLCREFEYINNILRDEIMTYMNAALMNKQAIEGCNRNMNIFNNK